jgi:hypothetical protein
MGMRDAEDEDILLRARAERRVCVTLDEDFHEVLAAARADGPSVILLRLQGLRAQDCSDLLREVWTRHSVEKSARVIPLNWTPGALLLSPRRPCEFGKCSSGNKRVTEAY